MKNNNLKVVKIDKNKSLFNYEKKILIKELTLDLKLGYYNFEKEKKQKEKSRPHQQKPGSYKNPRTHETLTTSVCRLLLKKKN